jgi:hypothetical protein
MQVVHTSYQKPISRAIYVSLKKMQLLRNVIPFWRSHFYVYVWEHCDGVVMHGELFEKIIWHTLSGTTWLNAHRLIYVQNVCVCWLTIRALQGRNKDSMNIFTLEASRQFLHLFIPPAHTKLGTVWRTRLKTCLYFVKRFCLKQINKT